MEKEKESKLSFGQTVYLVRYFAKTTVRSPNSMMHMTRSAHYRVVECRVIISDNKEVYLHSIGFVDKSEIFIDKDKAEEKLKQLEEEKEK